MAAGAAAAGPGTVRAVEIWKRAMRTVMPLVAPVSLGYAFEYSFFPAIFVVGLAESLSFRSSPACRACMSRTHADR
ncbi:MAG: hypothetical protein H6669_06885 [Ardenticatenaceae bacterium]|nr:hypothetical protein [Ardenticatenaceae bacterium]